MSIRNSIKKFMGMEEDQINVAVKPKKLTNASVENYFGHIDDCDIPEIEVPKVKCTENKTNEEIIDNITKNQQNKIDKKIKIFKPTDYDEAQEIANDLKKGRTVIVNLNLIDTTKAARFVDFLYGVVFGLDGDMHQIGDNLFVCGPEGVDIDEVMS